MDEDRKLTQLVRAIFRTPDEEIDCSTCLDHVATYVEQKLAGADVARTMPHLYQHLTLCGDCYEEYLALRDLVVLDRSTGLPEKSALLRTLEQKHHRS